MKNGHVIAGLWVSSPAECQTLMRAVEAGMRGANTAEVHKLHKWWVQLRNMRWRALAENWVGWYD